MRRSLARTSRSDTTPSRGARGLTPALGGLLVAWLAVTPANASAAHPLPAAVGDGQPPPPTVELADTVAAPQRYRPPDWTSFRVTDGSVKARLDDLMARSQRLARAIEELRAKDFVAIIGTPEQVHAIVQCSATATPMDDFVLAQTGYFEGDRPDEVSGAIVRIEVTRLRAIAERRIAAMGGGPTSAVEAELARILDDILIHEIWGHLVPVGQAEHMRGHCPDPAPGDDALDSCVLKRENGLRLELGLEAKRDYGVDDPAWRPPSAPLLSATEGG
jgi:hypothetical protein